LLGDVISMLDQNTTDLLVRAFQAAWDHYFRPGRDGGVLECLARPALARFLVERRKEGMTDEPSLAAAGLQYLFSLEDPQEEQVGPSFDEEPLDGVDLSWSMHLANASAQFVPIGRVYQRSYQVPGSPKQLAAH
jgi:hypothetical protein